MNIVAWILQVLLALVFLFHFVLYAISPEALVRRMREQGQWPPAIPEGFRRFIGIAELAGAIGLIVPALTHTLPWLVPLAALGLAVVTISASVYHLRRGEPPISAVVAALALVVVYLRWQVVLSARKYTQRLEVDDVLGSFALTPADHLVTRNGGE